jgi:hypothetical protein
VFSFAEVFQLGFHVIFLSSSFTSKLILFQGASLKIIPTLCHTCHVGTQAPTREVSGCYSNFRWRSSFLLVFVLDIPMIPLCYCVSKLHLLKGRDITAVLFLLPLHKPHVEGSTLTTLTIHSLTII